LGDVLWLTFLSSVAILLGPVLFLIYINNLDEGFRNFVLKFVDDTKVFGKVMDDKDFCKRIV